MRRTYSRLSSGVMSQTPPGREGNGGEGRESFSANAQHGGAAASSNAVAELANALLQALQMAHEGGPIAPTELLRKATNGLERLGRYRQEAEQMRHALVAADLGRGDRGGRNAGHGEKSERNSGRGQQHTLPLTYCARHGEGQGHNTSDCIVIRRELDRNNGDFHQYADDFPGGHGHERNRHHPSGCLLYTSPSPRDKRQSRMPSSA